MLGDTLFSWALADAGVLLTLQPRAVFVHDHGTAVNSLVRERFSRGRQAGPIRASRAPGVLQRVRDVATTASLVRLAQVTLRSARGAWRSGARCDALLTVPVVAAAHAAWFAGELVGMVAGTGTAAAVH